MDPKRMNRALPRMRWLLALAAGLALVPAPELAAQCQLLVSPAKFDPPGSGLPSYFQGRGGSLAIAPGAKRLLVRYNYGYLSYDVTAPAAPTLNSVEDLLGGDRYPKNGDGQDRVGKVAVSADGQRALIPWTDLPAGYGTIVQPYGAGNYGAGGDFLAPGYTVSYPAVVKIGSRYIGFSTSSTGLWLADVTNPPTGGVNSKNEIPSEVLSSLGTDLANMISLESNGRAYVVAWSETRLVVLDATNVGTAVPNLGANMTWKSYAASSLGVPSGSTIRAAAVAAHPADGALYLLVEGARYTRPNYYSTAVSLTRLNPASGDAEAVGTHVPATGENLAQYGIALLPGTTDVTAYYFEGLAAGGVRLHVRSSTDFATNLASSISAFTSPAATTTLVGYRGTGTATYLYMTDGNSTYVSSLNCSAAPGPATAQLAVENVGSTGTTSVPDGGSAFIGDQLRIKPTFTPPDTVTPLSQWRLDYDFHDGNAADSQGTAMRLLKPDASGTQPALPASEYTLVGPCDPAQVPEGGSAPSAVTGAGCWASVTSNGTYGIPAGTSDFDATTPADKQLKIAFEVQNSLNAGSSSVAVHRVTWKVPQQLLKSSSILSGGTLEDASQGSPLATGYKWYFSQVPVAEEGSTPLLNLEAGCTGPTCAPTFTQSGQTVPGLQRPGDYRYWVVTPYRNGFTTAECPGLAGTTCTGSPTKTVKVTDVVLSFTAPTSVLVGQTTFNLTSSSKKASSVAACPAGAAGFSYNVCQVLAGACTEGTYTTTGISASNPFPSSGTGLVTIATPSIGTWGIRVKYSYSAGGSCASPSEARWPANGSWAPLTVMQGTPTVHLRNASDTADIPKSLGYYWELTAGTTARAYADLDGVRDTSSTASSITWHYRLSGSSQETSIGTGQGPSFSISTPGEYEVVLRGYGSDVIASVGVATASGGSGGSGGGGGSSGGPPTVTSVTASPSAPTTGQTVTFTCNATSGGAAITSYDWVLDTGVTRSTGSRTTTYSYSTTGTKTFSCVANDSAGYSSSTRVNQLTVSAGSGGGSGSCAVEIKNASTGGPLPYDSQTKTYYADSGVALSFVASGATGTVSWNFGNGATGTGTPYTYTYPAAVTTATYTVNLSATGCTATATIEVAPGTAALDYTVTDAGTGAAVEKSGTTWVATAGQRLKFTGVNATGAVWWDFGDGTNSTLAAPEKTYTPLVDTTYTASLSNNGATKSYSISVKGSTGAPLTGNYTFRYSDGTVVNRAAVTPNKAITFTAADQATSYTWDFGDGSALAQGSPKEYSFTRGGTFVVKLTVARTGVAGTVTTAAPLSFVVTPPPDPLLWVAGGMAYADGSGGERWQSDLSIFNPGTAAASVSLAFVPGSSWDGATRVVWSSLAIGPGETRAFANILAGFFSAAKGSWGVVLVRGDVVPVSPVIVSRTYNAASSDVAGTFGLSVPAMSVANGVKPQSAAGGNFLAGLRHDDAFRTNLTVANLKDETAVVEVVFRDAAGNVLGSPAKVTVEGRGVKQLNGALSAAVAGASDAIGGAGYATPASQFSAEVKLKSGSGVYPYATVIDQGTGDSIVVAPTARPSPTYRLPGIVRVLGGGGTYWVSDIAILNPTANARKIRVSYSYVKSGTTRRIEVSDVFAMGPYQLLSAVDFVRTWLGLAADDPDGYASSFVDVSPAADDPSPTSPLVVTGKTYTPSGRGSIGLQLDAFSLEDGINDLGSRRRLVLSGLEASSKFRTNVALFLTPGSTGSIQVDVRVLDSFGRESKKIANVGLDTSNPFVQINSGDLFAGFSTDDASRATIIVENPRGTAYLGTYATVIDQKSGDATFVAGQPAP